jgi:acetyl-CoA synthetase
MDYDPIKKGKIDEIPVQPNLANYDRTRATFEWEDVEKGLDWFDNGGINIAYEVVDRHLRTPLKDKIALYWEGKDGETEAYSFHDLSRLSNRFANVLRKLGVKKGDRVFTYMDRIPEQYIGLLGALKAGGVIGPLFSAFGPDAVKDRLGDCEAKVLMTSPKFVDTVHEILGELPALDTIIIVNKRNTAYDLKDKEVS